MLVATTEQMPLSADHGDYGFGRRIANVLQYLPGPQIRGDHLAIEDQIHPQQRILQPQLLHHHSHCGAGSHQVPGVVFQTVCHPGRHFGNHQVFHFPAAAFHLLQITGFCRYLQLSIVTGLDHALAERGFVDVPHLGTLQRHQPPTGQLRQQTSRRLGIHRIHSRMHLAARRHAQHGGAQANGIHQITGGAIATGKQDQFSPGRFQCGSSGTGVIRAARHGRLTNHRARHLGCPATVLAHVAAPGHNGHITDG